MEHKRGKWIFPELLKSIHCLCPYIQLSTVTQHKWLLTQQYLQTYTGCLPWLVDCCCPKQDQPLYTPAHISYANWINNTEIWQTVTLYIEIQSVVVGICKYQSICTILSNILHSSLLLRNLRIRLHRIIILPVVLYLCATWSLTLMEERRLRLSEQRVSRRMLGPRRDEVTGEWRKLHYDGLNDMCSLPNIFWMIKSRRREWLGHAAHMGETRGIYRVVVGKPEEKNHFGDPGVDGRIILR